MFAFEVATMPTSLASPDVQSSYRNTLLHARNQDTAAPATTEPSSQRRGENQPDSERKRPVAQGCLKVNACKPRQENRDK